MARTTLAGHAGGGTPVGEAEVPVVDNKRKLLAESDRLLAALDEIRAMEARKRAANISTDEFNELADRIHEKSREIFQITGEQEAIGHAIPESDESIDDLEEQD